MMWTPFRLLGIFLICTPVLAGSSYPGRFHRFERLTFRGGTSPLSAFTSICQDKEGFLWFGTNTGLARYDGYRLISFNPQGVSESSAAPVGVFPVTLARSGDIWVGTNGRGLFRFLRDSGVFVQYRHDPLGRESQGDDIVLAVQEDQRGSLWLGTRTHGLEKWDGNTRSFTRVPLEPSASTVWDVLVDSRGTVFTPPGGKSRSLARIAPGGGKIEAPADHRATGAEAAVRCREGAMPSLPLRPEDPSVHG